MFRQLCIAVSLSVTLGVSLCQAQTLRLGLLPAADSIVIHVAVEEGFFKAQGLDVSTTPFKSALELGAAMRSGQLDGHFGDLMNVMSQNARGVAQTVVLTTTHTSRAQRAFALVVAPAKAGQIRSLADLHQTGTAMSAATIIDYLLERMRQTQALPQDALKSVEIRQIPIRLQMLLSGQVETALLPEPLVSVVEQKGGTVLWDDRSLDETLAVVALKNSVVNRPTVEAFRRAVAQAARAIEDNPDKYRELMVKKGLLPAFVAKNYKMVRFSLFEQADGLPPLPTQQEVERVGQWMQERGMIGKVPALSAIVWTP